MRSTHRAPCSTAAIGGLAVPNDTPHGPILVSPDGATATLLDDLSAQPVVLGDQTWLIGAGVDGSARRIDPNGRHLGVEHGQGSAPANQPDGTFVPWLAAFDV